MEGFTALWKRRPPLYGPIALLNCTRYLALVVNPRYAESEDTVRLDDTFNDFGLLKFGMLVVNLFDRFEDFAYCLQVFAFTRVAKFQVRHQFLNIHD